MSWRIVNRILGLAAADPVFWQAFQRDPLATIQEHGFELTEEEREAFRTMNTEDLAVCCQSLLEQLASSAKESNERDV
jgi:hypothetical protein